MNESMKADIEKKNAESGTGFCLHGGSTNGDMGQEALKDCFEESGTARLGCLTPVLRLASYALPEITACLRNGVIPCQPRQTLIGFCGGSTPITGGNEDVEGLEE
jgi:hypothetical protein